ncbi:MAG: LysE family transporter [Verrucomicrobiota bacterium]|nr:LysE family transporter [Verrucomicrobiota bacterium]
MDPYLIFKGIGIGLAVAAPVGPVGILCIRRALAHGTLVGFASGLGAAVADGVYGGVAAFGLSTISDFLIKGDFWFSVIGGVLLFYFGWRTYHSKPVEKSIEIRGDTLVATFLGTLAITMTNPATILGFILLFASLNMGTGNDFKSATVLVTGIFLGSALWWLLLSMGVGYFRTKLSNGWMILINRVSGIIIAVCGLAAFVRLGLMK